MTPKKTGTKAAEVKKVATEKVVAVEKEAIVVKAEPTAIVEIKAADEKKAVEVKAVEVKAPVVKKEAKAPVVKKEAKAPEAKKAASPAKKPAAKKVEPKATVHVQFGNGTVVAQEVLEAAKKAYAKTHKGVEVKSIEVYVKPEESAAYYAVNGVPGTADDKVELKWSELHL